MPDGHMFVPGKFLVPSKASKQWQLPYLCPEMTDSLTTRLVTKKLLPKQLLPKLWNTRPVNIATATSKN